MPVRPEYNPDWLYFVTTTAIRHVSIFNEASLMRILLDSLAFLRESRKVNIHGFVLMPNHIHFIARFGRNYTLADGMRDYKRHTARSIIRYLESKADQERLKLLNRLNHDNRQVYKIWEDGYDAREIYSTRFLEQKMAYIHYNPCQPQWNLAELPEDYPWSTAAYYILDRPPPIVVDDARDVFT
jgi:REP element-mobilizing transposase RayT